ncbi:MAG: EAL domain-containing protein [Gammaproteobacteria bacterium]|nr:MAG: EAL domain-containing protein [Gammaproteobacteria bacterium]
MESPSDSTAWSRNTLSRRLLNRVLTVSFLIGVVVSLIQIISDARSVSETIDKEALETLEIVKDAATQAVYAIDEDLGEQVLEGLFKNSSVRFGAILHPDESVLASRTRPLRKVAWSPIIDFVFGAEREYAIPLYKGKRERTRYGDLRILYDTVRQGSAFMERSILVLVSGIIRAMALGLILYMVSHYLVTRPIQHLTRLLQRIDPARPDLSLMRIPKGHEHDELGVWVKGIRNLLSAIIEHQQHRKEAESRIIKLSQYDPLTGLPNRSFFRAQVEEAIRNSGKSGQRLAIFCVGIDDFKNVNEQYGYSVGDRLLQALAERLSTLPDIPVNVARLGGDQFALIVFNTHSNFKAATVADRILKTVGKTFLIDTHAIGLTASIGMTLYPEDGEDAERLIQKAEQTMMLAKSRGHNQYQFYVASIDAEIRERRKLQEDLRNAIMNDQLFVVYQPQVDLRSREVVGAEALLRWRHDVRGLVPPDVFIPIAESSDLIHEIGDWVLDAAVRQIALWREKGIALKVAVNLSAQQFSKGDLPQRIVRCLTRHSVPPEMLELEVTETSFMRNLQETVNALSALRGYGIETAVDDFGTGYASLSYLKKLPVAKIKIDKQFVQDLLDDPDDTQIVLAIIQLGKSLGLKVIAEGVETTRQEKYLLDHQCVFGQGYLFSKPLSPEELERYIQKSSSHVT